jgi:hypothetical protein
MLHPMNPTSLSRVEGPAVSVIADPIEFQDSRLWDRARSNLTLLYGGRRGGSGGGQVTVNTAASGLFGNVDLKI